MNITTTINKFRICSWEDPKTAVTFFVTPFSEQRVSWALLHHICTPGGRRRGLSFLLDWIITTPTEIFVEPLSVIWDRPIWKAQALDRSLPCGGDIAKPRQADARCSRLNRGLATSLPWLLQEAGGLLS